jgi:hypothetical protein
MESALPEILKHRFDFWLSKGLRFQRTDPEFRDRLDRLDAAISRRD